MRVGKIIDADYYVIIDTNTKPATKRLGVKNFVVLFGDTKESIDPDVPGYMRSSMGEEVGQYVGGEVRILDTGKIIVKKRKEL